MSNIPSREEVERELAKPYPAAIRFGLANRILKALWEASNRSDEFGAALHNLAILHVELRDLLDAATALYEKEKP